MSNEGIVEVIRDEYLEPKSDGKVGAAGIHIWDIKGVSEGRTTMIFRYYRSWEGPENAADTKEYVFEVDDRGNIKIIKGK